MWTWGRDHAGRSRPRLLLHAGLAPAAVCATLLGLAAGTASGDVVIGQGIAGVKIGDTEAQVRSVLGPPSYHTRPSFGPVWNYGPGYGHKVAPGTVPISVVFWTVNGRKEVGSLFIMKGRQATSNGMRIGTSYAQFKSANPDIDCSRTTGDSADCIVLSGSKAGRIETDFQFLGKTTAKLKITGISVQSLGYLHSIGL